MPTSAKPQPVGAMMLATSRAVAGATALQSAKSGFFASAVSTGERRCASALASPGGITERTKSALSTSFASSSIAMSPAASARAMVALLRPFSEVRTVAPRIRKRWPMAAPISPAAMTTMVGAMTCLIREFGESLAVAPWSRHIGEAAKGAPLMWSILSRKKLEMPSRDEALPGRPQKMRVPEKHFVNGNRLEPPFPAGLETAIFAMGCFWGAEKAFWQLPGVYSTAVGYAGGFTPNPTYQEVCSGETGQTEVVRVIYGPQRIS